MMKLLHVASLNRPAILHVDSNRRVTLTRPYYQIRDEFGRQVFATYSQDKFWDKFDELAEQLSDDKYTCYVQDDVTVDGVFQGFKRQRPVCFNY